MKTTRRGSLAPTRRKAKISVATTFLIIAAVAVVAVPYPRSSCSSCMTGVGDFSSCSVVTPAQAQATKSASSNCCCQSTEGSCCTTGCCDPAKTQPLSACCLTQSVESGGLADHVGLPRSGDSPPCCQGRCACQVGEQDQPVVPTQRTSSTSSTEKISRPRLATDGGESSLGLTSGCIEAFRWAPSVESLLSQLSRLCVWRL